MHRSPTGALLLAGLLLTLALAGCTAPAPPPPREPAPLPPALPPFPAGTAPGTTRVFAHPVPEPGFPEGIVLRGGRVYVTVSNDSQPTGHILVYDLASGALLQGIPVDKPPGWTSRLLGLQSDAEGRLYVADTSQARLLRLDPSRTPPEVATFATFPDLPPCLGVLPGSPCAPTVEDLPPFPDYLVFGPRGEAYVTDFIQATIFRVPPGGGEAEVWFQDARFGTLGPNGLALDAGDAHLYVGLTGMTSPIQASEPGAGGAIYRLPTSDAPGPADLELFHFYPGRYVDGIAFGASGRLYVTLISIDPEQDGISVLDPNGQEVALHTTASPRPPVPFDFPASIAFHDRHRSILVTNQAFRSSENWAVLETFVDDTAQRLHEPVARLTAAGFRRTRSRRAGTRRGRRPRCRASAPRRGPGR